MTIASLCQLQTQLQVILKLLIDSLTIPVEIWRYHADNCSVFYISCRKEDCHDDQTAFITLLNHTIHYFEEWQIADTQRDDLPFILNNQVTPYLQRANWLEISAAETTQCINSSISTVDEYMNQALNDHRLINPDHWGCFYQGVKCDPKKDQLFFSAHIQGSAIELLRDWNEEEIFYQTSHHYVLYCYLVIA